MDSPLAIKSLWKDCEFRIGSSTPLPLTLSKYVTKIFINHSFDNITAIKQWDFKNIHSFVETLHDCHTLALPILQTIEVSETSLTGMSTIVKEKLKTITLRLEKLEDFSQFINLTSLSLVNYRVNYTFLDLSDLVFPPQLRILKLRARFFTWSNTKTAWNQIEEFWWEESYDPISLVPTLNLILPQMPNIRKIQIYCTTDEGFTFKTTLTNTLIPWLSKNPSNRLNVKHYETCIQHEHNCPLGWLFRGVHSINAQEAESLQYLQTFFWNEEEVKQVKKWYNESTFCTKTIQFLYDCFSRRIVFSIVD
jgi:hypothetical protein